MNHPRSRNRGRSAIAALVGLMIGLTAALVPAAGPVVAQEPTPTVGAAAGRFLAEETRWHTDAVVVSAATASDVLLAWAATGSEHTAAQQVKDTVVATIASRTGLENTARTLLALAVYDVDITAVGARNLDADLRALTFTEGANEGRFKTAVAGTTPSTSVPIHSRAMLALAMTDDGVPAASTTALASTQCANGSFPATWASATCNGLEVTALAAQALRAGGNTTDAAEAEAWIASVQAADGSFSATSGTNSDLVGLAAQTLRAGGNTTAADAAAAYVTALQLGPDATVWDHDKGAIAQTAARRDTALAAGEIGLGVRVANFRNSTMRAVLALGAPALVDLSAPPVSEPPAEPERWYEGACEPDDGVTVVADFRTVEDRLVVRCALGNQISGWAALANAGLPVGSVQGYPGAAICQVDGLPAAGYPTCWYDGYWSYWHAPDTDEGTAWTYSSLGYNNRKPALNSVEGSRYVQLSSPNAPPAVGPHFPTPTVDITAGPEPVTVSTSASFEFASSETESSTACSLDGAAPAPCTSPLELTGLAAGDHELEVTATTPAARRGSDTWSWRVLGAAECGIVPQAPTFDIVHSDEDLTFTLADGHPVETAVLTDLDADPATAAFTPGSVVDLAPYQGDEVRVLARRSGGGCPATEVFDHTYDVRNGYAPRWNLTGAPGAPSPAVASNSADIVGWATAFTDYTPGANVNASFRTPQNAIGPATSSLVVLGDRGEITLAFKRAITDGDGADLAVFENGFAVGNVANGIDFLELGYVEVSSNGTDFVRFDTGSRQPTPVGGFQGQKAELVGGMAGKDLSGRGTPFDLSVLRNKPEVRSGAVDLSSISYVRIVDITGDGLDLDSFGRPIYDAHPTTGSAGFDLTGVGVLNQVDGAAIGEIDTFAGTGTVGVGGDGMLARHAQVRPGAMAWGPDGSLYFADSNNGRVRRIHPGGTISLVAGGAGLVIEDGQPATSGTLAFPTGVAVGPDGSVYIAERDNARIRRVTAEGNLVTVAGGGTLAPAASDGGPATDAQLNQPFGMRIHDGKLYFVDKFNQRIRTVDLATGVIDTVVGTGTAGPDGDGGPAIDAQINGAEDIEVAADGTIYIADTGNRRVRVVSPEGIISTLAGTGVRSFTGDGGPATAATLIGPSGVTADRNGNVYFSDQGSVVFTQHNRVRRVDAATGVITTVAGTGAPGFNGDRIPATTAQISSGRVLIGTDNTLYLGDAGNHRLRMVRYAPLPPKVTVTARPDALTTDTDATVAFTVAPASGAVVECQVDGGAWEACASPFELTGLTNGDHTVAIRASSAGTEHYTVTVTWTVDTGAPAVDITDAPTGAVASAAASVGFTVDDASATVDYRLDGGAWTATEGSPIELSGLADGDHTVEVRATDAAGNVGSASASWTVDTTAPVVEVTEAPADGVSTSASVGFTVDDASATVEHRIDGGDWTATDGSPLALADLTVGDHTVEIRATDPVGNEGTASVTWTVVAPRAAHAAWVWAAYEDFLGREPSPTELSAAVGRLDSGVARSVLARELARSDEWITHVVTGFYSDTLGRNPSASEVEYWAGELRSGRRSVAQVAASFYGSPEYFGGIGGGTNSAWITDLYGKLLGRSASVGDVDYWSSQVIARGRGWVALQMFQSLESRRARVEGLYQELLGRSADAAGRDYWAGRLTAEGDIALARSLAASPEYLARAQVRFP